MRCFFCYIPFDRLVGNGQTAKRIIDKLSQWNILNITFGGGDPLMYEYFCDLVDYAREKMGKEVLIQVDTNGLRLDAEKLARLAPNVNAIGLPLETTSIETAIKMRRDGGHPAVIMHLLGELTRLNVPIKINTVVTAENLKDLAKVGSLLSKYPIRLWSLYQFWSIEPSSASIVVNQFVVDRDFVNAANQLISLFPQLRIEVGLVAERAASYFFVTQTGRSYTVRERQSGRRDEYVELGSIFDDDSIQEWVRVGDPVANRLRARKRGEALAILS